jgi:molecular chaperone DnaK
MEKLNTTSAAMGQAMYAAAQAQSAQEQAGSAEGEAAGADDDDVVDAEIVDDENDKGDNK